MGKYLYLYKLSIQNHFSDAGKTFVWIVVGAAESFVMAFTWLVVSNGSENIGNLKSGEVISYYLFLFISWYIIGGVFHQIIGEQIKSGKLSTQLTKPIFPYAKAILSEQGWKTFGLITGLPLLAIFIIVFNKYLVIELSLINFLSAAPAVIFGAFVFGLIEFILGNAVHWIHNPSGLHNLNDVVYMVLGGYLAPIALLPELLQDLSNILPFRYAFAWAIDIFQGRVTDTQLLLGYGVQLAWLIILYLLAKWIYYKGLRQYEAFGN